MLAKWKLYLSFFLSYCSDISVCLGLAFQSGLICLVFIPQEPPEGILPACEGCAEQFYVEKQLGGDQSRKKPADSRVYEASLSGAEFGT